VTLALCLRFGLALLAGGLALPATAWAQYESTASQCLAASSSNAVGICTRAFNSDRVNARVAIALAEALKSIGQAERAVQVLEQARAAGAGGSDLGHALRIARSYLEEQRFQDQQEQARAESDGGTVRLRVESIKCETLSGQSALTACEAALRLAPADTGLRARRDSLRASLGVGGGGAVVAPPPDPSSAPAPQSAPVVVALPPPRFEHSALGPKPDPNAPAPSAPPIAGAEPPPLDAEGQAPIQPQGQPQGQPDPAPTSPPAVAQAPEDPASEDVAPEDVAAVVPPPVQPSTPPPQIQLEPAQPEPAQPEPGARPDSVLVLGGEGSGQVSSGGSSASIAAQLVTLRELREQDLLTEEDYQARRRAILLRAFERPDVRSEIDTGAAVR